MLLVGIIIARYIRTFKSANPASFYLHVGCQLFVYAIGVASRAIALWLVSKSKVYSNSWQSRDRSLLPYLSVGTIIAYSIMDFNLNNMY